MIPIIEQFSGWSVDKKVALVVITTNNQNVIKIRLVAMQDTTYFTRIKRASNA